MNGSQSSGGTKVTVTGRGDQVHDQAALASLCTLTSTLETAPVFVDVYDSGYGHGI